jgi:hypothetical protein
MFVRFVVHRIHPGSGVRAGIFQAASVLRGSSILAEYDSARLNEALTWFDEHLPKPNRFSRSRRPHRREQAISWFKAGARKHLAKAREMQGILDTYGLPVEMITARRPGYVVYEDEFQATAYPFNDTPT